MGSCRSSEKIESAILKDSLNLDSMSLESAISILKESAISAIKSFETQVITNIKPDSPLNLQEFEEVIRSHLNVELDKFNKRFPKEPKNLEILTSFRKFKIYLCSKFKSKEGYFRYTNDLNSFEYVTRLQHAIIQDFFSGTLTSEQSMQKYQKLAKGTFTLTGFETLFSLLKKASLKEAMISLDLGKNRVYSDLNEYKLELEKVSKKAFKSLSIEDAENSKEISCSISEVQSISPVYSLSLNLNNSILFENVNVESGKISQDSRNFLSPKSCAK